MQIISGLSLLAAMSLLVAFGRPAASGAFSTFVSRPGIAGVAAYLATIMTGLGIGLVASGLLQLGS
jgi:hypothetical protein